jgi:predicted DNA-binding protein (MmcQ/YjbR family)
MPRSKSRIGPSADVDVATMQAHCLGKPGAWTDFPWDHDFPVVKVGEGERGKIFAFLGADSVGVKGGPTREVADEWLDRYPEAATVMRYIGRSGWNSLAYAGIPDDELLEAIDESYRLVVGKMPKKDRPEGWDEHPGDAAGP